MAGTAGRPRPLSLRYKPPKTTTLIEGIYAPIRTVTGIRITSTPTVTTKGAGILKRCVTSDNESLTEVLATSSASLRREA